MLSAGAGMLLAVWGTRRWEYGRDAIRWSRDAAQCCLPCGPSAWGCAASRQAAVEWFSAMLHCSMTGGELHCPML